MHPEDVFKDLIDLNLANLLYCGVGLVPGYWATFALIENKFFGRKRIQLLGFAVLTVLFIIIGTPPEALYSLHPH